MRIILFFDLPTETSEDRRNYARFRKYLIKNGFVMLQESVYSKLAINQVSAELIVSGVKKNKPPVGLIQSLIITEKQYERMEYLIGEHTGNVIDTDERYIEI